MEGNKNSCLTRVEYQWLAGDTGAAVIHGQYVNSVAVTTCEVTEAAAEVRGLTADIAVTAVGCHCVLYSTSTGRP